MQGIQRVVRGPQRARIIYVHPAKGSIAARSCLPLQSIRPGEETGMTWRKPGHRTNSRAPRLARYQVDHPRETAQEEMKIATGISEQARASMTEGLKCITSRQAWRQRSRAQTGVSPLPLAEARV